MQVGGRLALEFRHESPRFWLPPLRRGARPQSLTSKNRQRGQFLHNATEPYDARFPAVAETGSLRQSCKVDSFARQNRIKVKSDWEAEAGRSKERLHRAATLTNRAQIEVGRATRVRLVIKVYKYLLYYY
jgi:hypothetical protein